MTRWLLAAALLGCKNPTPPIETDLPSPQPPTPEPEVRCNSDLETVGVEGGHAVDTIPFTWQGDALSARSPGMKVRLPEDTLSLALTGLSPGGTVAIDVVRLNTIAITDQLTSQPLAVGAIASTLPTSLASDITQDVPFGGSCLFVRLLGTPDLVGQTGELKILTRRGGSSNTIDLNLVFVGGTDNQLNQTQGQLLVQQVSNTWSQQGGPSVGEVTIFSLEGNALVTYAQATEIMGAAVQPDDPTGVDIFFFRDAIDMEGGVLGFAGGIPGVLGFDGVPNGGVAILLDAHRGFGGPLDGRFIGNTVAHEVGHQLGLAHSTEANGSSNALYTDVPRCGSANDTNGDGIVDIDECVNNGGDNFMFWAAAGFGTSDVSPEQAFVLRQSAVTK